MPARRVMGWPALDPKRRCKAGDEALNQARQTLTTRFSKLERNGIVRLNASVHLVTGTRQ